MPLLIIGGTGFISSGLVDFLLEDGHRVVTLTRSGGRLDHPNVIHLRGDRNRRSDLQKTLVHGPFDAVFDMVAYEGKQSRLAADVFRGKTRRFIHCSTISVYMVSRDVRCPITEGQNELEANWLDDRNPFGAQYGLDKRDCEDVLWEAHDADAFPVTMLRPTYVGGPGDPVARDAFWIARILDGRPILVPGSGDIAFQQVFVDDVARAFASVIDGSRSIGRAYNIASHEFYSLNEYLHLLGRMLGREPDLVHIDRGVFRRLPFSTYPGAHVFPFDTGRTAVFDLTRADNDLGFTTTPFEEWMAKTIEFYRERLPEASFGYENRDAEVAFAECWRRWYQSAPSAG